MSDHARSRRTATAPTRSLRRKPAVDDFETDRIVPVSGLVARRLATDLRAGHVAATPISTDPRGLMVGRVDDPHERHADEVADRVIAGARRQAAEAAGSAEAGALGARPVAALRRSAPTATAVPTATAAPVVGAPGGQLDADLTGEINRKRGSGEKLPEEVSAGLGELSQAAGAVRIHDDADSDRLAKSLSAKAFTVGNDVFFAGGEYRPDTEEGQHTLAHEVAHAANGENATRRISRKYNLKPGKPLGLAGTRHARPFGQRSVWQLTDGSGDKIVVKMENQPLGLNDLTTAVHKSISKTDTVVTKPLLPADEQLARGVLVDPRIATGPAWEKVAHDSSYELNGRKRADFPDLGDWGRWVTQYGLLQATDPMIAMSVASGESAETLLDPMMATQQNAGTAPFRTVLERRDLTRKLGELTAVDIFLGNDDRVLSGNLGNWFYNPDGSMTAIDNINDTVASEITQVEYNNDLGGISLDMLYEGNLPDTARTVAAKLKQRIKAEYKSVDLAGKQSVDDWFDASNDGSNTRYENMLNWIYEGLIAGRKRVIKTFNSTRFKNSSKRSTKKALKKQARKSQATDQSGTDYYDILKQRAKLVSKNGGRSTDPGDGTG